MDAVKGTQKLGITSWPSDTVVRLIRNSFCKVHSGFSIMKTRKEYQSILKDGAKRNLANNVNRASIEPVECITGEMDDEVLDQVWIDYHELSRSFITVCKRNSGDTFTY